MPGSPCELLRLNPLTLEMNTRKQVLPDIEAVVLLFSGPLEQTETSQILSSRKRIQLASI